MKRKTFIKLTAGAAAGSFFSPMALGHSPSKKPTLTLKKSLKYGMVKEKLSVLDKFKMLKDVGFDGVELDSPNELDKNEVLNARDRTGLLIPGTINSVHWKSPLSDPRSAVRKKCIESMKTALQDTKDYGGTTVLLVPGVVNEKVSYQDAYERSQKEIKKLIPLAKETGVRIALENVWNNFLLSPLEAARYVDELKSDYVGWYMDVGNVVRFGWPEQWIKILGHRILKVDAKGYSRKLQNKKGPWEGFNVKINDGDCNWPVVMKALEEVKYSGGWISAEVEGGNRKRLEEISLELDKAIGK